MAFKTTPVNFLENIPENKKLKKELMTKFEINEHDIEHPLWDTMMSEYVSRLYSLIHM